MGFWARGVSTDLMVEALEDEEAMERVENQLLSQYVRRMGGNPKPKKAGNISIMLEWLRAPLNARPYVFMPKKDLLSLLYERGERSRSAYNAMNKDQLIQELSGEHANREGEGPVARKELWKRLIGRIIKATFMPKLVGKGKEYAKVGHKLEQPLLLNLLEHQENPQTILQILRPGLVAKNSGMQYVKTSVDAIGLVETDGVLEFIGIEVKVRATGATRQNEIERRSEISDSEIFAEYEVDNLHNR